MTLIAKVKLGKTGRNNDSPRLRRQIISQHARTILARWRAGMALLALLPLVAATGLAQTPPLLAPSRTIVLTSSDDMAHSLGRRLTLIYTEAFRRLGYTLVYRSYPNKRAIAMSDAGEVDGEIHRYAGYAENHPDMVRVETPHFMSTFSAYANRSLALGDGWTGLASTQYRVEYRAGAAFSAAKLPAVVEQSRLVAAYSAPLGLRKLLHGRSDVYVDAEPVVEQLLAQPEFAHAGIRRIAVMETVGMHAFLYKTHRALAVRLAATLADMKREGLLEKYRIMAESEAAPGAAPAVSR